MQITSRFLFDFMKQILVNGGINAHKVYNIYIHSKPNGFLQTQSVADLILLRFITIHKIKIVTIPVILNH